MADHMSTQHALAALHDIHLPTPIGWWPPAPGWYVLACLVLLASGFFLFFLTRRYRQGRMRRQALRWLATYRAAYDQTGDARQGAADVSELLKRIALVYFPRQTVAGLQGAAWVRFLNETATGLDSSGVSEALLEAPYQPLPMHDLGPLFDFAQGWIRQRRGSCSN